MFIGKLAPEDKKEEAETAEDPFFDPDNEEMQQPGKLVKLEHAYLRRVMAGQEPDETESKEAEETREEADANTSSSIEGISKRKKRKRKVDVGVDEAAAAPGESPRAPKSPTPDYSTSSVQETSTPASQGKKKKRKSVEVLSGDASIEVISPSPGKKPKNTPQATPGGRNEHSLMGEGVTPTPKKKKNVLENTLGELDSSNVSMVALPPTPHPNRSRLAIASSTPNAGQMMSTGKKNKFPLGGTPNQPSGKKNKFPVGGTPNQASGKKNKFPVGGTPNGTPGNNKKKQGEQNDSAKKSEAENPKGILKRVSMAPKTPK